MPTQGEYTPGPWRVLPEHGAQSRWIIGDAEGGSIADCEPPGPWITGDEADANARLIAAAPELLAALIQATSRADNDLKEHFRGRTDQCALDYALCMAAIAKATSHE